MKFLLTFLLFLTGLTAGNQAKAGNMCAEVFKTMEIEAGEYYAFESLLKEFEAMKIEVNEAKNLTEANNGIHSLVVTANRLLDRVIDIVVEANLMPVHPDIAAQRSAIAERLVEELQVSFGIENKPMVEAIQGRVGREIQEIIDRQEYLEQKRAIGFGRDQSSESFHAEKVEPQPIGFIRLKDSRPAVEIVEKIPMGFRTTKPGPKSIEEIVEFVFGPDLATKDSIGFIPVPVKQTGKDLVIEKEPIGFNRSKFEHEPVTPEKMHQILFDIETGFFDFVKAQL